MWEDDELTILDRYVDRLDAATADASGSYPPTRADKQAALFWLARKLKDLLWPVEPSPAFRQALHAHLLNVAYERTLAPASQPPWPGLQKRGLLIGAALGSLLSIAGVVAVVVRLRWASRHAA